MCALFSWIPTSVTPDERAEKCKQAHVDEARVQRRAVTEHCNAVVRRADPKQANVASLDADLDSAGAEGGNAKATSATRAEAVTAVVRVCVHAKKGGGDTNPDGGGWW